MSALATQDRAMAALAFSADLTSRMEARRLRTLRQFVEQELVLPSGPLAGTRFKVDRQPAQGLFFDQIDSGRWRRIVATGPQQSGKTVAGFVAPTLYHLFEIGERVIWGVPDADMANDKWRVDLRPAIERTRYRDLLPTRGEGARGGRVQDAIVFGNGAELKIMTRGGSDKQKAGYTARVVVITETDGLDTGTTASREADPIIQMEGRTAAYGERGRIYMECTVSTEDGRTWTEYQQGTATRIAIPCPHCGEWVTPEREHLHGWQDAETVLEARRNASLCCPSCAAVWTEQERVAANRRAVCVHRGQEVSGGAVVGDEPETDTLGFRWTAANNCLVPIAETAVAEWRSARDPDGDNGELRMRQFFWVQPWTRGRTDEKAVDVVEVASRAEPVPRGLVPDWCDFLTAGIDVGRYRCHWVVIGWNQAARGHVIDYGQVQVPSSEMAEEIAIGLALREFRDLCAEGWPRNGQQVRPALVLMDSGYKPEPVYAVATESGSWVRPAKGIGVGVYQQGRSSRYSQPKGTGSVVQQVGDQWHLSRLPDGVSIVEANVDHWKGWVMERLRVPLGQPAALSLYHANPREHLTFAKHLTAEKRTEEFVPKKGMVTRWVVDRKDNHWLDAATLAAVAASGLGARVASSDQQTRQPSKSRRRPRIRTQWDR